MNTCYCCQVKSYNACCSNIVEIKRLYSFAHCQIETFKWMLQGARQFSYADWVVPTSLIDKATNSAFIMLLTVWPSSRESILYPDKQGPKFLVCFLLYEVSLSKTVTPYKQQSCVLWLNLHSLCISNILLCVKQKKIFFCCCWPFFFFQSMTWSPVRTLEHLGLGGTLAPGSASVTQWRSPATQDIVSRGCGRLCAWEVAAACGVPLCQGVWVRGQLFLFRLLSCMHFAQF